MSTVIPEFAVWLRDQRENSGMTLREISLRVEISRTAIKDALRGAQPGAKAIRRLGHLFGADDVWLTAWLAATHERHVSAGRARASVRGPQPVPEAVFVDLRAIAADPTKPTWSRWVAARMVETGLSRRALDRALGEPILRQQIGRLLSGASLPAVKTLARLGAVLGPVPDDVLNAAATSRREQNRNSQATRKDKVRRWPKEQLVTHLQGWFGKEPLPRAIKRELGRLGPGPVGVEGFRILRNAQVMRMRQSIDPGYTPTGPGELGPQPRLVVRRALVGLRRHGQRGGLDARICLVCGELTLLPNVHARRPWRGRCEACWLAFTRSPNGIQWGFEVQSDQRAGAPVRAAPPPQRGHPGPLPDADRAAAGLTRLLERALGEAVPDPEGADDRLARNAKRLLKGSSNPRCRRLEAALDGLRPQPTPSADHALGGDRT